MHNFFQETKYYSKNLEQLFAEGNIGRLPFIIIHTTKFNKDIFDAYKNLYSLQFAGMKKYDRNSSNDISRILSAYNKNLVPFFPLKVSNKNNDFYFNATLEKLESRDKYYLFKPKLYYINEPLETKQDTELLKNIAFFTNFSASLFSPTLSADSYKIAREFANKYEELNKFSKLNTEDLSININETNKYIKDQRVFIQ